MSERQFSLVRLGEGDRGQLEQWARMLGYRPEMDDSDSDLRVAILTRWQS